MIRIIFTTIGVIIGEKINSEAGLQSLKEPRVLQFNKETGAVTLIKLLGEPKGFTVGHDFVNYDVTDENMIRAYKESVTGLTLIKTPAEVQGMN